MYVLYAAHMPDKVYECGLDAAIDVVGGKWKPMVLWALATCPRRFGALRRSCRW